MSILCLGGRESVSTLTEDVFELGGLALALLEVAAEDDLLAVLSGLDFEWSRGD